VSGRQGGRRPARERRDRFGHPSARASLTTLATLAGRPFIFAATAFLELSANPKLALIIAHGSRFRTTLTVKTPSCRHLSHSHSELAGHQAAAA
jgi:hypothetical protein